MACNPENPRRGASKTPKGVQGLGGNAYERMIFEIDSFTTSDLRSPVDKEEIEYRVGYVKERTASFNLDSDGTLCKYSYKKAIIKEVVSKVSSEFEIATSTTPTDTTYVGIPIANVKEKCEAAKEAKLKGTSLTRKLDLADAWKKFKAYLKSEVRDVIDACEKRAIIMGGKCMSMNADVTRDQEVLFDPIIVYKFGANVDAVRADYTIERSFTLNYSYFTYFGMIHMRGMAPLEGQDLSKAIDSLEVLTWKR